jgi:hypothetical protein
MIAVAVARTGAAIESKCRPLRTVKDVLLAKANWHDPRKAGELAVQLLESQFQEELASATLLATDSSNLYFERNDGAEVFHYVVSSYPLDVPIKLRGVALALPSEQLPEGFTFAAVVSILHGARLTSLPYFDQLEAVLESTAYPFTVEFKDTDYPKSLLPEGSPLVRIDLPSERLTGLPTVEPAFIPNANI